MLMNQGNTVEAKLTEEAEKDKEDAYERLTNDVSSTTRKRFLAKWRESKRGPC